MKPAHLALLALLLPVAVHAADAEAPKLMKADQDQLDKAANSHLKEATKAFEDYQKALADASDKTIKDLEKLKAAAMKNGDLPLAVAVDAKEKDIHAGSLGDTVAANAKAANNVDLLGVPVDAKQQDKIVVGKWTVGNGKGWTGGLQINADGTAFIGGDAGKWVIKDNVLVITYDNGNVDKMTTIDEVKGAGINSRGVALTFVKQP